MGESESSAMWLESNDRLQQKQTLNEVENLYFHHYRARTSQKGTLKPKKGSANTSTHHPPHASTSATAANPSPVARTHRTELPPIASDATKASNASTAAGEDESSAMDVDPPPDIDASIPIPTEQTSSNSQITPAPPHSSASAKVTSPTPRSTAVTRAPSSTKPLQPSPIPHTRHLSPNAPVSHTQSPVPSSAVSPPVSRNNPPTRNSSLPQPASSSRSRGSSPVIRPSHSAPLSSMSASSNVALTYDSFWSSHSTNYRPALTSTATSYPNINKGDANLSLPGLGSSYAFSMGAPSSPCEVPMQKQPTLARKPSVPPPPLQQF
ncbi:hypothetical protein JB92DRAFT_2161775 [Gautieria morchelliformis]|nr:hypothetical protein JB92DRAFT_2161775 [Gautieria morchelliformis]